EPHHHVDRGRPGRAGPRRLRRRVRQRRTSGGDHPRRGHAQRHRTHRHRARHHSRPVDGAQRRGRDVRADDDPAPPAGRGDGEARGGTGGKPRGHPARRGHRGRAGPGDPDDDRLAHHLGREGARGFDAGDGSRRPWWPRGRHARDDVRGGHGDAEGAVRSRVRQVLAHHDGRPPPGRHPDGAAAAEGRREPGRCRAGEEDPVRPGGRDHDDEGPARHRL
ncbi:MAG: hypothetical protein AVDCRST_MAG41-815, partial [uncultured Corynebacteriales bacterium]